MHFENNSFILTRIFKAVGGDGLAFDRAINEISQYSGKVLKISELDKIIEDASRKNCIECNRKLRR